MKIVATAPSLLLFVIIATSLHVQGSAGTTANDVFSAAQVASGKAIYMNKCSNQYGSIRNGDSGSP